MSRLRRLGGNPQEVNFFLFLALFALVIGVIYWFASYEAAGTVLLLGFAIATGATGIRLAMDPRAALARRRAARTADEGRSAAPVPDDRRTTVTDVARARDVGGRGPAGEGVGGIDRPFLDEGGRLPAETLAPFAVGLGIAVAATGSIFGLAPVIVGLLPLGWGAWTWLGGASAELDATQAELDAAEARRAAVVAFEDGRPVEATPGRTAEDR